MSDDDLPRHRIRHSIGWTFGVVAAALTALVVVYLFYVITSDPPDPDEPNVAPVIIGLLLTLSFIAWTGAIGLILYGAEGSAGVWGRRLRIVAVAVPAVLIALSIVGPFVGNL
ncbi:MAG TPA: hypothetical protein VLG28_12310 [Acidimicrobiia bacterium]|jgi:hypothetical protein|nr:hypothetical protein [Acidimicrobiia bacterium]